MQFHLKGLSAAAGLQSPSVYRRAPVKAAAAGTGFAAARASKQKARKQQRRPREQDAEGEQELSELSQAQHIITVPDFAPALCQNLRQVSTAARSGWTGWRQGVAHVSWCGLVCSTVQSGQWCAHHSTVCCGLRTHTCTTTLCWLSACVCMRVCVCCCFGFASGV